ncbi:spore cortex biosynthesis protein YabQ [Clostridium cavendishii DSM 21758]|uniref:Spore cortex biosynthesis protein YabQ n=1 Tax=Clostridium cavendishii DSM 21758 TaxID=1121302 RepID=A0A1M6P8G6_9CLOT|nr:spore cortex biosynthesis protein YabQ [Clostridium cavendishii]SHK04213.1 spore cortex biosynthesis protein YabQ [Clostridium cavendishii DSM 21758]
MLLPLEIQIRIVLSSLVAGLIIGVVFDLYRLFRGFRVPKLIIVIEDILFWILCAMLVFIFLLYVNYALLSVYVYFFILIGDIIYLKLVSPYFISVENKIGRGFLKGIRVGCKNLSYAFRIAFFNKNSNKK